MSFGSSASSSSVFFTNPYCSSSYSSPSFVPTFDLFGKESSASTTPFGGASSASTTLSDAASSASTTGAASSTSTTPFGAVSSSSASTTSFGAFSASLFGETTSSFGSTTSVATPFGGGTSSASTSVFGAYSFGDYFSLSTSSAPLFSTATTTTASTVATGSTILSSSVPAIVGTTAFSATASTLAVPAASTGATPSASTGSSFTGFAVGSTASNVSLGTRFFFENKSSTATVSTATTSAFGVMSTVENNPGQNSRYHILRDQLLANGRGEGTSNPIKEEEVEVNVADSLPLSAVQKKKRLAIGCSRHSSSKLARVDAEKSYAKLMSPDLKMYEGIGVSLTDAEATAINSASEEVLLNAFLELQSRALVIGSHIVSELSKGGSSGDFEKLKAENAELRKSMKGLVEEKKTWSSQVEDLRQQITNSQVQKNLWKTRFLESKDKEKKAMNALAEITLSRDNERMGRLAVDKELWDLKECVVEEHEEGFRKALRQVTFLFNISTDDERLDVGKDVYEKKLVPIEDIRLVEEVLENNPTTPSLEAPGREQT